MEQRCQGTLQVWAEPFTSLRVPKIFNLRTDPFEYADITSNTYYDWLMRHDLLHLLRDGDGDEVPRDVQGISPAASTGELHVDQASTSCTSSWPRRLIAG